MNKFLRKNNKKLLAVFGVFLMIAFVVQTRYNPSSGGRGSEVIGRIGSENLIGSDLENARQEWRLLNQAMVVEDPEQQGQYQLFFPQHFPPAEEIDQNPKLYLLLLKEADRMRTSVSDQEVLDFLAREHVDIRLPSGSITHLDQIEPVDPDYAAEVKSAVGDFLRVEKASMRVLDLCKFSRPLREFGLAQAQNVSVRFVAFDANKLKTKVPAPTTQQLQQQFDQFASAEPSGTGAEKNPLGFGYQIPDQVLVQSIAVPRGQIKAAVEKSKSDYDWKVLEWEYYLKHKADFATTQPVAPPPTAMMTLPTTQPSPTTKPFDQVRSEILDKVMAADVDDLSDRVQKSILATMTADWTTYHAAHPDTQPTTGPTGVASAMAASSPAPSPSMASSLGVPYDSYDYLKALALKVQKEFNVLPETAAYNKPMTSPDLSKLAGIGHAHTALGANSFAITAMDSSYAVFQPSPPLTDDASTFYAFRVTQRIAAHRPASIADVADVVRSDWIKGTAYQMAIDQAKALHDAAAKAGLMSAGPAAGQLVTTTPPFSVAAEKATDAVPTVPLAGEDLSTFKQKCQSTMEAAAKHEPPVAIVEAPNEMKALVIELADVQPDWPKGQRYVAEADVTRELLSDLARPLQTQWFTLAAVEARLGYTDAGKSKDAG
jgi:hypothetical protein